MILRIEKFLFYLFLFLIPFQIRFFLHNAGNEWNSIFLYAGDLIFIAILILVVLRKGIRFEKKDIFLLIFILVAGLSLFATSSLGISAYRFIKLLEFVLLYKYICSNVGILSKTLSVLFYSGVLQAILAIAQFIKQGSIGIKFIEAGIFSPNSPGVANFILNGERIMRSYGSFLHPNVLAAFLLLAIFAFYALFLQRDIKGELKGLVIVSCFLVVVFALFLTFSRTAIVVFGVMSLIFFLIEFFQARQKQVIKLFGLFLVSCILAVIILFPYLKARFFTISMEEQAIDLRFFYNKMALSMIKEKPILGIGIGNFVNYSENYPAYLRAASKMLGLTTIPDWIYQPVHNIYLLIASEIGILGVIVFLGFIVLNIRRSNLRWEVRPLTILFVGFLILALADHYFWTLQTGGIMFWLALALTTKE